MRIIAGTARGTRLDTVEGENTRPLLDRVKESVFSMLASRDCIEGARVLDLYAGSGSFGIEALSRGARSCVFVDRSPHCVARITGNLERSKLGGSARVVRSSCDGAAERLAASGEEFDLVFADPPFADADNLADEPDGTLAHALAGAVSGLAPGGTLVLRAETGAAIPDEIGTAVSAERRVWGRSEVIIYTGPGEEEPK